MTIGQNCLKIPSQRSTATSFRGTTATAKAFFQHQMVWNLNIPKSAKNYCDFWPKIAQKYLGKVQQ